MIEDNTRTFADNWTGTGAIENSGDTERVALDSGEYMQSEVVYTGERTVQLLQNQYASGDSTMISYRHGISDNLAGAWTEYTAPFDSSGYVQVRLGDPIGDTLRADAAISVQYSGGQWIDPAGAHTWTNTNGATSTSSAYGDMVTLNGSNQALSTPADVPDLSPGNNDFTLVAAVIATAFPVNINKPMFIAIKDNQNGDDEYYLSIASENFYNHKFAFVLGDQGNYIEIDSNTFGGAQLNTLYLIFAWYDATLQTVNIQVNNGAIDSFTCPVPNTATAATNTLDIGVDSGGGTAFFNPFNGQIVFHFFNRKLSQDEKDYLYNSGAGRALFP